MGPFLSYALSRQPLTNLSKLAKLMRKRSETAETQRKHDTKWRRMCQMLEKREKKKVKKRQKRKENEATPNEIETFADSLKFPLLIMHGDNPNRSLLPYPLHAD